MKLGKLFLLVPFFLALIGIIYMFLPVCAPSWSVGYKDICLLTPRWKIFLINKTVKDDNGFIKPSPTVQIISPTISGKVDCNTGSQRNENCPPGCVYYGIPLGCVTKEYYDNCKKTHNCPL